MYNFMVTLKLESLQKLDGESSDQTETYSLEVIVPNKLIKVNAKQFEWDYQVPAENFKIIHSYYVVFVVWIIVVEMF